MSTKLPNPIIGLGAGRYKRTLEEAFGPYERGYVHPMPEQPHNRFSDLALYVAALLAVIVIVWVAP